MIQCAQLVCYGISSHKSFKSSIVEMTAIVANYGSRDSKAQKNVLFQEFNKNLVVISPTRNGFYPFLYIVDGNQYVLVPKLVRKRIHKVNTPNIKEFYF